MEERMDNLADQTVEIVQETPKFVNSESNHNRKFKLTWILIGIFVICAVTIWLVYFISRAVTPPAQKAKIAVISPSPPVVISPTSKAADPYVTQDTVVANSLAAPDLYPSATWKQASDSADGELGIDKIMASLDNMNIMDMPLSKGNVWKTTITDDSGNSVVSYYADKTAAQGWAGSTNLKFNNLTIYPYDADMPCQGVTGLLGYKDGMVRTITIQHAEQPCMTAGMEGSPMPKHTHTDYTVFVSDPVPLTDIASYLKTHQK